MSSPLSPEYLEMEKKVIGAHHQTQERMRQGGPSNTELLIAELEAVKEAYGEIIYPKLIEEEQKK